MNRNIDFIPFALPSIGVEEENAVLEVLRSGWLTTGKVARAFEEEFAAFVGARRALASTRDIGLLSRWRRSDWLGDEGRDESLYFSQQRVRRSASRRRAGLLRYRKEDYNIDPARLEELLDRDPSIRAVVPVHVAACPAGWARYRNSPDDEASWWWRTRRTPCPPPARGRGGNLRGRGVYCSMHKDHHYRRGRNARRAREAILKRVETMRLHGFDREAWDRYSSKTASWRYDVVEAGYKCNLPDILAALGRSSSRKPSSFSPAPRDRRALLTAFAAHPPREPARAQRPRMAPLQPENQAEALRIRTR